eukprot:1283880-Alexandrium_andersonii.AAC.1
MLTVEETHEHRQATTIATILATMVKPTNNGKGDGDGHGECSNCGSRKYGIADAATVHGPN